MHVQSVVLLTEVPLYHGRICREKNTRKKNTYSTSCTVSLFLIVYVTDLLMLSCLYF